MKYKTKEAAGLDKSVAELGSDKSGVETELAAVLEYLAKIEGSALPRPKLTRSAQPAKLQRVLASRRHSQSSQWFFQLSSTFPHNEKVKTFPSKRISSSVPSSTRDPLLVTITLRIFAH